MQNWNAGKTQEYKERREYNIASSVLKHNGPIEVSVPVSEAPSAAPEVPPVRGKAILFATPTCPNCRIACSYLDKAGFAYEKLMAGENAELAKKYGVKQAPTLIVPDGDGYEKIAGAGAIKQYLADRSIA